jgi:hypothetical protein
MRTMMRAVLLAAGWAWNAAAEDTVCASVKIEIKQGGIGFVF